MVQPQKTVKPATGVAQMRQTRPAASPLPTTTQRPQGRGGARSVGAFMPKLTKSAFEKFGFSTVQLLTDWTTIVGPQLAAATSPDRIKWPRAAGAEGSGGPRAGATLHVRVEPARALDVQYKAALIIDRINGYFGYRAVADIRIVQAQVAPTPPPLRAVAPAPVIAPEPALATIADDGLRSALERMQAGIASRKR